MPEKVVKSPFLNMGPLVSLLISLGLLESGLMRQAVKQSSSHAEKRTDLFLKNKPVPFTL